MRYVMTIPLAFLLACGGGSPVGPAGPVELRGIFNLTHLNSLPLPGAIPFADCPDGSHRHAQLIAGTLVLTDGHMQAMQAEASQGCLGADLDTMAVYVYGINKAWPDSVLFNWGDGSLLDAVMQRDGPTALSGFLTWRGQSHAVRYQRE